MTQAAANQEPRINLIKQIEERRGSRVICYIMGDRRGLETRIASDQHSLLFEHLNKIGFVDRIDVLLYTVGGITVAGWGVVSLIREFCNEFAVLVPYKAYSCGTLIALGADEIVMAKLGQLSPVDPSVTSPYNPPAPGPQMPGSIRLLPVSVEDVIHYIDLAKEEVGLREDNALASIVQTLSANVHPLALGNVYRIRPQIEMIATRLLRLHMSDEQSAEVERIVNVLTKELGSHDYLIGRKEAKDEMKLKVVNDAEEVEQLMWDLYTIYATALELGTPYNPEAFLGQEDSKRGVFPRAIIESEHRTDVFRTTKDVARIRFQPPGAPGPVTGYQEILIEEGWVQER